MSKYVTITCVFCKNPFERLASAHARSLREGWKSYCSHKCKGKDLVHINTKGHKFTSNEAKKYSRKTDELSTFRFHLNRIKHNSIRDSKDFNLTLQDLKEIWDKQNGRCPYTNWKLKMMKNTYQGPELSPDKASVDRIDNSKGYTKDNIQFVAYMYNMCKNKFTDKDVENFAKSISNNINNKTT